jgi:wobble nucleotide-excising tRNase
MIHKIERLVSIGKFRNYNAAGQVNFHKLTLIYGDNGGGKTTLTSVIRSLTTNNTAIVRSRISTNHTTPQAAQIIQAGTPPTYHTYGSAGWTIAFPDIEIFDIHFVNENVYSGFDFNDGHKRQLHQFVIGAQGVAIRNQIEKNKADKTASRQLQSAIESQIIQQTGNNLRSELVTSFLNISLHDANGIGQRVITAEQALTNARANSFIQGLQPLSSIISVSHVINFADLIRDLQTTSQNIQDAALQELFSNHCSDLVNNGIDGAEDWLKKGFVYVQKKQLSGDGIVAISCPFCKQEINNALDIVKAYTSKFNEEFNSLVQRIERHLSCIQSFNLDAAIQSINNVIQINASRISSWRSHLPNAQEPNFRLQQEDSLRAGLQTLTDLVRQKLRNPSTSVSTGDATVVNEALQAINSNIAAYNQSVTTYNNAITTFRAGIQTVTNAQVELDRLRRIEKRFEPAIDALCNQLISERQNLRNLEATYSTLAQQQESAATVFFTNYQSRVNHYLGTVFKTPFRIDNVAHVPPQGRSLQSRIDYKLTIDGRDISFDPAQPFNAKDCLSEGDKSTIALALFLSKLDVDPNRQNRILIFDDPLSSLDTNRRTYTIGMIRTLLQQMKQVVVLSHNEYFLHEIGRDVAAADKKTLRITENFAARASIIEVCDLDELVKNDYFKHIEALEAFRVSPNHTMKDTVLGWLRNVLESHLRFKFYKEIRAMTGQKTFGRLISFLDTSGVVFRDNANRQSIIASLNLINSVSWKPHHGVPMPNYSTLGINPNTITAPELDNLIQDTLNLVENQL